VLAIVAPGQGAQTPGFLAPWLELPGFRERMDWLSAVADLDLIAYGTEADADTIRDTAVAQPLLVSAGMVSLLAVFPHPSDAFDVVGVGAGHSVGEITAAAGAHVISAEQAMVLVRERGRTMAAACQGEGVPATGMTAVVGGERDDVLAVLARLGLTPANDNGAGQIVAAGTLEQLAALAATPPEGARLRALPVAGAFHTDHMSSAVTTLGRYAKAVTVHDPRTRLLSNRDGSVVHSGPEVLSRIVRQVSAPVRWDLCMQTMKELGVTGVIELPPAGVLTGLIKRALPGVETVALKTPDDLDAARALVDAHGTPSYLDDAPTWRLLVAPVGGTFRAVDTAFGDSAYVDVATPGVELPEGCTVGLVVNRGKEEQIQAPHGGTVVEWLVEDGDPVSPGQPLVRLHPQAAVA
jgi:[acyl-carrier-protein] S-malonyltransferase